MFNLQPSITNSQSPLSLRVRDTIRRDPISWTASCGINLRPYQRAVALAIKDSIIRHLGLTFVVIFPRQSGKNELQAHIFSWLLFRFASKGSGIVSVSPTYIPQTANNMCRVRLSLDTCIGSRGRWKSSTGLVYGLGKACIQFYSGSPHSKVVGAVAHSLLSVDEAQEISTARFVKEFDPMTASNNATHVFWGTAWMANTLVLSCRLPPYSVVMVNPQSQLFNLKRSLKMTDYILPPNSDTNIVPGKQSPSKGGAPLGNKNALGRGAPPGNKNAVKHGLYSHWFSRQEHKRLDKETLGELDDEEFGLKITLDRIIHSMSDAHLTHDQIVVAGRAVGLLSGRIESIHRSRKAVYDDQTALDKVWEELKYISPEED